MDERMTYLRQSGFVRLWQAVKEKYERHGRVGGKVTLEGLSTDEIDALSGLLTMNLYGRTRVAISLSNVDQALQGTKFRIGLVEVLKSLFPDIRTREESRAYASARWTLFCDWAKADVRDPAVIHWILRLGAGEAIGYRTYLECFKEYENSGDCRAWRNAVTALERALSPHTVWRLPIFAAVVTGDPHGLDRDTLAGKMFYWGLVALTAGDEIQGGTSLSGLVLEDASHVELDSDRVPKNSESRSGDDKADGSAPVVGDAPSEYVRMVYMKAGIQLDDVSSIVWVANWPGLSVMPVALPLMAFESYVTQVPAVDSVYVVENPSVFAVLIEQLPVGMPVVCTSGQPSVSALRLFDMAVAAGTRLYYNGDFDVKGLQMAISLRRRYGDAWVAWHMNSTTYRSAYDEKQPSFVDREVEALNNLDVDWDAELIATMTRVRKKVFQEHIVLRLLRDLEV